MPDCLSDEQMEALASGEVATADALPMRTHMAQCSACRQAFEEWTSNLPFAATIRTVLTDAGAPPRETEPPLPPHRDDFVNGYEIIEQLHQGAQGIVYHAIHRESGRHVAIKFLHHRSARDGATLRRFDREIELVRALNHEGIIRVRDRGVTAGGKHYYIMDYVEGPPLHHYVWDHHLPLEDALDLFLKVCDAVNYAHQRGVIHRDLKPSNILVDAQGVPHVLDFGLAKQLPAAPESLLSITGQVFGTLPYMSPEQALGRGDEVDIRTDVYALGVILYQILTGTFPYPVTGPIPETIRAIRDAQAVPPRRAWTPGAGVSKRSRQSDAMHCPIDEDIETILLRALAKEPERRYPNVLALSEDLSRYRRGQPIEARREAGFYNLTRTLTRYRVAVVLTGIGIVVFALFASIFALMYQEQVRATRLAAYERGRAVHAQVQLGEVLLQFGDTRLDQGDTRDAIGQFLAALAIYEDLANREPDDLTRWEKVADTLMRLGDAERLRGDGERAMTYYRRFHDMAKRLAEFKPQRDSFQERLAAAQQRWALVNPATQSAPAD